MSSKKTTSSSQQTQNTTQNSTSTPDVPDWLLNPSQQLAGQIGALNAQGPSAYAPTTSDLQNTAFSGAQNLDTSGSGYTAATNAVNSVGDVTPQSLLDNLSAYENPYKDQVVNSTLADFDAQAGQTKAANAAAAAQNGAFGGSRYGIQAAQSDADLARARATTESGLLSNMFTQATGLSATDAAARQAAATTNQANQTTRAGLLGQIASSQGTDARANLALQGDLGAQQSAAQTTANQYPLQFQQQMEGLLADLNPALFTGSTSTGSGTSNTTGTSTQTTSDPTGSVLSALGSAAKIAALFTPAAPAVAAGSAASGLGMDVMGLW